MTRFLSGPCSNRLLLAAVALALWIYFAAICLDCQPAIAAIRDKKDSAATRSRGGAGGGGPTTTPRPEEIVERWRASCRRTSRAHDDEGDQQLEVREWSEALLKCGFDMPYDDDGSKMLRFSAQHPFGRLARAYFEYANNFNELAGGDAPGGDGDDVLR